ncbi:MAG TPA: oxaloacetate decarboxylase subunit alpha [Halanaerobiales bacterium]|nr:oxaloacetate decarboxylase subunit alpha [Halanaerobiales bacterium]
MTDVKLTETILRDGHQSLLATRMETDEMLPVLEEMDKLGYHSMEVWGGATFDSCIRYLNEDPWERLRKFKQKAKNTPLQMLLRGQNILGYKHYPDDVLEKFVEKSIKNGIDIIRIFDALNDVRNLKRAIEFTNKYGGHAQGTIVYTTSPLHDIEHYIETAKEVERMGADSLCLKDMAGLLAPFEAYNLIKKLKEEINIPIQLHAHNTTGMAAMTYLKAVEAGVDVIDTALSALGSGSSQPSTEPFIYVLQNSQYDTGIDFDKANEINEHFRAIRDSKKEFLGSFGVDPRVLKSQIPGGMLSNLRSQLKDQNMFDKYDEVLKEVPKVRAEMGYPPLVTPTSQIIGIQAVFNVATGDRYSVVSKEIKNYIKGQYGTPPGPIDEDLKEQILKGESVIEGRYADQLEPALDKYREEIKEYMQQEEDVLTYALFPSVAEKFFEKRIS